MKWISQQFKISVKAFHNNASSVLYSFYYSTDDALLRKAFTDILNCCSVLVFILLINFQNSMFCLFLEEPNQDKKCYV